VGALGNVPKHVQYYVDLARTESELGWAHTEDLYQAPVEPNSKAPLIPNSLVYVKLNGHYHIALICHRDGTPSPE